MNYETIKSIPTLYSGIKFRSRLEATWAAYFDLLHWKWEYEPCDFNGWIPDFLLCVHTPVFVEVKPVISFPREIADEIDISGCQDECLIVGISNITSDCKWTSHPCIGWLEDKMDGFHCGWAEAAYGKWKGLEGDTKNKSGLIGFCHTEQSFHDRITGCYDGGTYGTDDVTNLELNNMWSAAKNTVQWRSPK